MSKKVLICPLDWGLGHATRCIPVVRELERNNCTVMIAGSGPSLDLLRMEFPSNSFFTISSYGIKYSDAIPFVVQLMMQARRLLSVINQEHREILDIVEREKIDFLISDNRYGCYHDMIPTAIIIHQLSIPAPPLLKAVADRFNSRFIRRFSQCWVPDSPDRSLSGDLSKSNSISHKFIGPLSRMTRSGNGATSYQVLGLVSGPEPHRTTFESLLNRELSAADISSRIVRGLPAVEGGNVSERSYTHLPSTQLGELIEAAGVVVSRSGYSTIMDLAALRKKAIFVPTPGQTEQLYLAKEMQRRNIAPMILQKDLSLPAALERVKEFTGFNDDYFKNILLQTTVREFLG